MPVYYCTYNAAVALLFRERTVCLLLSCEPARLPLTHMCAVNVANNADNVQHCVGPTHLLASVQDRMTRMVQVLHPINE